MESTGSQIREHYYTESLLQERKDALLQHIKDFYAFGGISEPADILTSLFEENLRLYALLDKNKNIVDIHNIILPSIQEVSSKYSLLSEYVRMIIEMGEGVKLIEKMEQLR